MSETTESNTKSLRKNAVCSAAKRLGLSVEEYTQRRADGFKWCCGCREWHEHTSAHWSASQLAGAGGKCRAWHREYARRKSAGAYDGKAAKTRPQPQPQPVAPRLRRHEMATSLPVGISAPRVPWLKTGF